MEWSTEEQVVARQLSQIERQMCQRMGVLPSAFLATKSRRELERQTGIPHVLAPSSQPTSARSLVAALAVKLGLAANADAKAIRAELHRRASLIERSRPLEAERIREVLELIERAESSL